MHVITSASAKKYFSLIVMGSQESILPTAFNVSNAAIRRPLWALPGKMMSIERLCVAAATRKCSLNSHSTFELDISTPGAMGVHSLNC